MQSRSTTDDRFPVHEELEVIEGGTIFKNANWWKAALLIDGYSGEEVGTYLWNRTEDGWKRKQKYVIRSRDDWETDQKVLESLVSKLE